MPSNDDHTESREREVDNTLEVIEHLTVHKARSILRWLVTNDEELDQFMLTKIANIVRETFLNGDVKSDYGINTLVDFPDTSSAKFQWIQIQRDQVSRADEEVRSKPQQIRYRTIP